MKLTHLKESLYLFTRHICCDDAGGYLFPPSRGTGSYVRVNEGYVEVNEMDDWRIDIGDGGVLVAVKFCPFCGELLEVKE